MNGQHFILDAVCDTEERAKLDDEQLMQKVLSELPDVIGMNKLAVPFIVRGAEHNPGLTGVAIIETSNIVLHTFTETGKFSLDIFSVKPIDEEKVLSYMKEKFNFRILRRNMFERL